MENIENMKRPIGLTIFAALNFAYAAFLLFLVARAAKMLYSDSKFSEFYFSAFLMNISYIIILLIPPILLAASGIGFLKTKRGLGYKMGNYAGIVSWLLGIALLWGLLFGAAMSSDNDNAWKFFFSTLSFVAFAIFYPLSLLLFLNFRYKKYFEIFQQDVLKI